MPMTLADLRKLEKDPLTKGYMDVFQEEQQLSEFIPVVPTDTLKARVLRATVLPTISRRRFGESFTESIGSFDYLEETVFSAGLYIDVDWLLDKDQSTNGGLRARHTKLSAKSMAYDFNDTLLNGAVGSNQPDGIVNRVATLASRQVIDGASVDISTSATLSSMNQFLDYLDQVLYVCDGHKADLLLGNDNLMLRLWSTLRRAGVLDTTQDQFGREIKTYKGVKLLDVGFKADQTTKIIPTTANLTSLYAARLGDEYLSLLQYVPLKVTDLGRQDGTPNLRTEVEWVYGFQQPQPRGLAVINSIKVS